MTTDNVYHDVFPASITGLAGYNAGPILIENFRINFPGRDARLKDFDPMKRLYKIRELPKDYPEDSMFGELPTWGLYMRHAQDITLKNVTFNLDGRDFRPAMVLDDTKNITLEGVKMPDNNNMIVVRANASVSVGKGTKANVKHVE
jgi:hypothetical protein